MSNYERMRKIRAVKNLGLSRPRSEREYTKSSCISLGVDTTAKSGGESMMFQKRDANELWGKRI